MSAREQARRDAELDALLRRTERSGEGCYYDDEGITAAYEMGKRHGRGEGPAWHDAPTCPGLWVNEADAYTVYDFGDGALMVDDCGTAVESWEGRWYGPIMEDEVKP